MGPRRPRAEGIIAPGSDDRVIRPPCSRFAAAAVFPPETRPYIEETNRSSHRLPPEATCDGERKDGMLEAVQQSGGTARGGPPARAGSSVHSGARRAQRRA